MIDLATRLVLAQLDTRSERARADAYREHASTFEDLRGWLRLCPDTPAGHAEFYAWASHFYFGTPEPAEVEPAPAKAAVRDPSLDPCWICGVVRAGHSTTLHTVDHPFVAEAEQ